ncbi:MAG: flagellar basal body P-ring formation chaperone FlgA [Zhongshania sp.]|uniref:flagellar basal body P-ring formation chaperone FlgA n=1 Tax=Zhongshania sp. TaxID=1971902 RepID=UPI0026143272|nr:flagellar basal body P-ring formation chaperone FlgA [Zhongshania sp.]MDF1690887.1 flagellar basal body P-ring formation chaperone FlgA [Zhongshania sp.]
MRKRTALSKNAALSKFVLLSAALSVFSATSASASTESHSRIAATAKAYIASRHPWQQLSTTITVQKLDPRTKLSSCPGKLEAFLSNGAKIKRRTTVGVRCTAGAKPWKIYLPVTVEAYAKVMVARHPIAPGTTISANDVSWGKRDITSLGYGYLQSLGDNGGYQSRQSIAQGAVLTPNMVSASSIVNKGQRVQLNSSDGPVSVSMMGIALQSGALGSRILVKNLNSGKQLEGVVTSENSVVLN